MVTSYQSLKYVERQIPFLPPWPQKKKWIIVRGLATVIEIFDTVFSNYSTEFSNFVVEQILTA